MPCNCGKKRIVTQPKKVAKTPPKKPDAGGTPNSKSTTTIRRIIRRAGR